MQKMKNIEFLRLVAMLGIVLLHFFHSGLGGMLDSYVDVKLFNPMYVATVNGNKGVDFFFILSGLFFYLSFTHNPEQKFSDFFKKKIIRLWPVLAFSALLACIFAALGFITFTFWDDLYALLFLNGMPLSRSGGNMLASWYCSALFWCLLLFFYMLKNFRQQTVWAVIAVGIFISYALILQGNRYHLNNTDRIFAHIFNSRITRAFGGIGLGMFIGLWYKTYEDKIRNYIPSLKVKTAISAIELAGVYFMINYLMFHKFTYYNDFSYVIVFAVLVTAFICNKGFVSQMLSRDIFVSAAKYTYSIYLTHMLIFAAIKRGFWAKHPDILMQYPITNLCAALLISFIVGVLIYHLVEVKSKNYLTKKLF